MSELHDQIEHLIDQKALGRSKRYEELLRYLGKRALENDPPTELEIALEVFRKDEEFDPNIDTVVRVYAHNLRKKLKDYYSDPKVRGELVITIPPGAYKMEYSAPNTGGDKDNQKDNNPLRVLSVRTWQIISMSSLLIAVLFGSLFAHSLWQERAVLRTAAHAAPNFWSSIIQDDRGTIIVYGDLVTYILSDTSTGREFTLRDYDVNSQADFDSHALRIDGFEPIWKDDSIVNKSEIQSVHLISQMLSPFVSTSIVSSSELTPTMVRENNIIYIGNLKALRLLNGYFQASSFELTANKRYLVHKSTGETLFPRRQTYPKQDYALLAKYDGPSGGQIVILGGNIAEGVLALGMITSDKPVLDEILSEQFPENAEPTNFEILIEAYGLTDDSYTSHKVVSVYDLDAPEIWSSECDVECQAQLTSVQSQ